MVYQYICNIEKINNVNDISRLTDIISFERKEFIKKLRFDKDKIRSILAEVILRYALWDNYGLTSEEILIEKTEYEKPYLKKYPNIHFNLSHSGEWVVCCVGDVSLGIDVEKMEDIDLDIMNDIFAKDEINYVMSHSDKGRLRMFYNIWTLKESYTKNTGEGLNASLKDIIFKLENEDISLFSQNNKNSNYSFRLTELDNHHSMSLCVYGNSDTGIKENLTVLSVEELLRWKG
ncbi:MAG: 4'-phosphopantetheinyl transferase superfamily protein [Lachnospiraceae bacterium]|nr:4'-phosphopantetheinyl transferase superfamily protein [Lachnospiraceae bacterium]